MNEHKASSGTASKNAPADAGLLVVVSSPSGGGKTTIVNAVKERMGLEYSVSTTTRPPRSGEKDGMHYNFVSKKDFLRYIRDNRFAEWAEVHGHLYGTDSKYIKEKVEQGKTVLLDIDVQGALSIKKDFPGAVLIFISPPSMEVLKKRLRGRATNSEESVRLRLSRAEVEMQKSEFYDYRLVNEDLEKTIEETQKIIRKEIAKKQEKAR